MKGCNVREEFEKWFLENYDKPEAYTKQFVENFWEAYQAGYIQRGQDDIKTNGIGDCSGSTK